MISWHPKEDTRKMIIAALLGMLVSLANELLSPTFAWNRLLVGTLLGAAVRSILALYEAPTVPAQEVKTLNMKATQESVEKVEVAKAADYPAPKP